MATNKVNEQTAVQPIVQTETTNGGNIVDFMWDNWLNGMKTVYSYQIEVEKAAMSIVERQKELWNVAIEKTNKFHQEIQLMADDARRQYQINLTNVGGEQFGKLFEEWSNRLNEISDRIKKITETPEKAQLTVITNSQENMEAAFKTLIDQQQKTREEIKSLIVNFVNQMKTTQKDMLTLIEENKDKIISVAK